MKNVSIEEHDFLEAADVIRMAVSNEKIADIADRKARIIQRLRAFGTAIDQKMIITLDDKQVVLIQGLGECRTGADEIE